MHDDTITDMSVKQNSFLSMVTSMVSMVTSMVSMVTSMVSMVTSMVTSMVSMVTSMVSMVTSMVSMVTSMVSMVTSMVSMVTSMVSMVTAACALRSLAAIKMSLHQYFRLSDISQVPTKWTMACARMRLNYFVVVVLSIRQIKRVARLMACNYERCVFVMIFSGLKIRLRLQIITLDKWIKKQWLKRFNRFKDQNMRQYLPVHIKSVRGLWLILNIMHIIIGTI